MFVRMVFFDGPHLALNSATTRLCIESCNSINVFLLIEYHKEDSCAHKYLLQFGFFHAFFFIVSSFLLLDFSPRNFKAKLKLFLPYKPDSISNPLDSGCI